MVPLNKLRRVCSLKRLQSVVATLILFTVLSQIPNENELKSRKIRYDDSIESNTGIENHHSNAFSRGNLSWLVSPEDFFGRLEGGHGRTPCRKLKSMGGQPCNRVVDGHKQLCLDTDVHINPRNCTVYSFGVSTEITFDRAMAKYGCEVHMMDPTLPPGVYKNLGPKMKFHPVGLYSKSKIVAMNLTQYADWQGMINSTLMTYSEVQQLLGHHAPVDYLKMDIENSEWVVLPHMMARNQLAGIKQIAVEIHIDSSKFSKPEVTEYLRGRWSILEGLEEHGFRAAHYEPTRSLESEYKIPGTNRTIFTCGELFLVNKHHKDSNYHNL
ncbi:probable methyltransferase-like protein 24 isoform X2 [Hyalella azteca]|uniref:Probable methyltransferase-like protein 24 isoform X2 n=1 Tax=Hyalella azteca TaxID=294128 RepID=A0A8B7NLB7_HYAAZ|nr:probable methyltransferase-like protein 24 isoform X2 [Hyalella azteca]